MKYQISRKAIAAYEFTNNVSLPFDDIYFEYSDSQGFLVDTFATKTVPVDLGDYDTGTLLALSKMAQDEMDAAQLATDLKYVNVRLIPEGLTQEQIKSVIRKWKQNPDGSVDLGAFFSRVSVGSEYASINWCGMYLGIEKDGYAHS